TPQEIQEARQQFETQHQLFSTESQRAFCTRRRLSLEDLTSLAVRQFKIDKFKQTMWGSQIVSYFLQRKDQLDQVIYSLLRTRDGDLVQELYLRIQENEESFTNLAKTYSEGPEAKLGGLVGPVALGTLHPEMGRILSVSQLTQLWPPYQIGEWFVILRLEDHLPIEFDDRVKQRLLDECFEGWLTKQMMAST
ncbi:MAG: peptidylprolyl isomerase, partial [Cyanobacteria bacterium P01_F01_bin.4]